MRRFIQQTLDKVSRFGALRATPGSEGRRRSSPTQTPKTQFSFSAVAIRPDINACDSVRTYAGKRMLEKNAPALPVPGCDVDKCGCRYQKFVDRRSGAERRLPFGGALVNQFGAYDMVERKGADRRAGRRKARPRAYFNDYD